MAKLQLVTALVIIGLLVAVHSYPLDMEEFEDDLFRDNLDEMLADKRRGPKIVCKKKNIQKTSLLSTLYM